MRMNAKVTRMRACCAPLCSHTEFPGRRNPHSPRFPVLEGQRLSLDARLGRSRDCAAVKPSACGTPHIDREADGVGLVCYVSVSWTRILRHPSSTSRQSTGMGMGIGKRGASFGRVGVSRFKEVG